MKRLQRGLIVAIMVAAVPAIAVVAATVALFASALWSVAQAAPPSQEPPTPVTVEASAIQLASLIITPTIGTTSGSCATSNTVFLRTGAPVYYCFTVRN